MLPAAKPLAAEYSTVEYKPPSTPHTVEVLPKGTGASFCRPAHLVPSNASPSTEVTPPGAVTAVASTDELPATGWHTPIW